MEGVREEVFINVAGREVLPVENLRASHRGGRVRMGGLSSAGQSQGYAPVLFSHPLFVTSGIDLDNKTRIGSQLIFRGLMYVLYLATWCEMLCSTFSFRHTAAHLTCVGLESQNMESMLLRRSCEEMLALLRLFHLLGILRS